MSQAKEAWEQTEAEFAASAFEREHERAVRSAEFYADAKAACGPKAERKREEYRHAAEFWGAQAARTNPTPAQRAGYDRQYFKLVKNAISKGMAVPQHVLDQKPEFRLARTARARYEKGRHTSFANRSAAVDERMVDRWGVKVKRQDGRTITDEQKNEIERALLELEVALGPLAPLFRQSDPTIAHTSGRHPFLSKSGGMYSPDERTITIGVAGQRSFAHEVAHWLDIEAGRAARAIVRAHYGKRAQELPSLAEADGRWSGLLRDASDTFNDSWSARQMAKGKVDERHQLSQDEQKEMKCRLSPYWMEPREIWARLVEQFVAVRLAELGRPPVVSADQRERYETLPAWWSATAFARLRPRLEQEIERRLAILRDHGQAEQERVRWEKQESAWDGLTVCARIGYGRHEQQVELKAEAEHGSWNVTARRFDRLAMKFVHVVLNTGGPLSFEAAQEWAARHLRERRQAEIKKAEAPDCTACLAA